MAKRQRGWTTLTDIEEFKTITWSFLKNITMTWEYDGMAYLFREARIPIYGIDRGTMKMNHPIMAMGIPMQRDKNYGVDIYVPAKLKKKANAPSSKSLLGKRMRALSTRRLLPTRRGIPSGKLSAGRVSSRLFCANKGVGLKDPKRKRGEYASN